jgi:hypothetical protein
MTNGQKQNLVLSSAFNPSFNPCSIRVIRAIRGRPFFIHPQSSHTLFP